MSARNSECLTELRRRLHAERMKVERHREERHARELAARLLLCNAVIRPALNKH